MALDILIYKCTNYYYHYIYIYILVVVELNIFSLAQLQIDPNMTITAKIVQVPNDQVGRLIGKNGCTIRQMQEVSGSHVEIAKACAPGSTMRDVTLTGTEQQVSRAEQLVTQKLSGLPLITAATSQWNPELIVRLPITTDALKRFLCVCVGGGGRRGRILSPQSLLTLIRTVSHYPTS